MRPPPPSRPNGGRVPRGPHPPPVTALCFRPWGRACPGPFAPAASPRPASRVRLGAPHGVRRRRPHRRCDGGSFRGGSFRGRRALSPAPPWVCPSVADLAPQAPAQASVWVPVPLSPPPGAFRGAEPLPGAGLRGSASSRAAPRARSRLPHIWGTLAPSRASAPAVCSAAALVGARRCHRGPR